MRTQHYLILSTCLTLSIACGSDPLASDEYVSLSEEVTDLNVQESDLMDQVLAAEEELAEVQMETALTEEFVSNLRNEIEAAKLEISAENERDSELSTQQSNLAAEVRAVDTEISDFKENSSRFQTAVRQSIPSHQRYLCQQGWKSDLSQFIKNLDVAELASNVGSKSPFLDADMRAVDADFDDVSCGRWQDDALFGSESSVLNRVCERLNIEQLKKNPSSYVGQCFRGASAWVVQYDMNTGPRTFHATLGSRYGDRVEFKVADDTSDEPLYEGVRFDWWAVGNGVLSYETTAGGTNTIPSFKVFWYSYYS